MASVPRTCPDCRIPLDATTFHDIAVETCSRCGGIFFDDEELRRLRKQGLDVLRELDEWVLPRRQPETAAVPLERTCPGCGNPMERFRYQNTSDVWLDECPTCFGAWVEDRELERIAAFVESGGTAGDSAKLAQATARMAMESLEREARMARVRADHVRAVSAMLMQRVRY